MNERVDCRESGGKLRGLPRGVWALGFVSLFMDISSEMVHSLLPVFFVSVLGLSYTSVGIIEGVAQAIVLVTRIFSGVLSDLFRRRKPLAVIGYGIAALTKPVFALATTAGWVVTARFADRFGKGIRGAPRDALLADITPGELRGAGYGLRQSLDSVGAFAGPLLAIFLMALFNDNIRTVFWFALLPAAVSVLILVVGVHEPPGHTDGASDPSPLRLEELRHLGRGYWTTVSIGALMGLAGFSEAFLVLRAQDAGLAIALVPAVFIIMNTVYALSAYPAGVLSDRLGRRGVLVSGLAALVVADGILAAGVSAGPVLAGAACWGLYMGLTQGVLAAMVADTAPARLRGTAFGLFSLVSGIAMLLGSVIAGLLWDAYGAPAPFIASGAMASVALAAWWARSSRDNPTP